MHRGPLAPTLTDWLAQAKNASKNRTAIEKACFTAPGRRPAAGGSHAANGINPRYGKSNLPAGQPVGFPNNNVSVGYGITRLPLVLS